MNLRIFYRRLNEYYDGMKTYRAEWFLKDSLVEAKRQKHEEAVLIILNELGGFYRAMGRYSEAAPLFVDAICTLRKLGLFHTENHATTLINQATNYAVWGKTIDALELFEAARLMFETLGITVDFRIASLHNNMSIAYQDMGEYDKAVDHLKDAIAILEQLEDMKNGKFADGEKVLRAKIDMASPNINMRDPVIYRVARMAHHRTGDTWCIYPMYDFAHPIEDAIEGITHSICTLEFEDHRPLYDWVVRELEYPQPPKQIEFAKLYLTNVITGKRYIKKLVEEGIVDGWDDPRLVSIAALRRRGFTPESIKKFVELCGVSKANSSVDYAMLEYCIREDLKLKKPRMMAALDPIKLVIDNYPEGEVEYLEIPNNLENEALGSRQVPFCRELYIDRDDFMEEPPKKYFRLFPGNEVRLMSAYFVTCTGFEKDENGKITTVHCTYDPETKQGSGFTGRKVKGTIHWVPAPYAVKAEVRLYENIVDEEKGVYNEDGSLNLNPNSLTVLKECYLEPALKDAKAYESFQFVRQGFFNVDYKDSTPEAPVFNRIVSLKSSFVLPK